MLINLYYGFLMDNPRLLLTSLICVCSIVVCFTAGALTRNCSQVDKLWSILPVIYCAVWTIPMSSTSLEYDLLRCVMMTLVCLWGARLTTNFFLRGGYKWPPWRGDEDYRWEIIRKWNIFNSGKRDSDGRIEMNWTWTLFHFGFICLYQNILLASISAPFIFIEFNSVSFRNGANFAQLVKNTTLTALMLLFICVEAVADHQRNIFHKSKELGKIDGFCQNGLFAYSRHPNYACEMLFWFVLCLFTVDVYNLITVFNWSYIGFIQYFLLFQKSTSFTEEISVDRYGKKFIEYQKRVPKFIPSFTLKPKFQ